MSDGRRGGAGDGAIRRAGERREIRLPVGLFGTIAAAGAEPVRVHVADLSRGGARCHVATPPPVGSTLDLRLDGLCVSAVVCWVSEPAP